MSSDRPGGPAGREEVYAALWAGSDEKPYDDEREASVVARRFASVAPAIQRTADRLERPLRLLDFGCADGHTADLILRQVATCGVEYFGCDVYPLAATAARMAAAGCRVATCDSGLAGMPDTWPEFDVVLALSCLQYIPETEAVISELTRRMAPDGLFIGYVYDAAPLRKATDDFLRASFDAPGLEPQDLLARLAPLAALNCALREAIGDTVVDVPLAVPELGIAAGQIRLQQLLIDHVLFTWAPPGATRTRVQWALGELLLTGPQVYLSMSEVCLLLERHGLVVTATEQGPSGALIIAKRA